MENIELTIAKIASDLEQIKQKLSNPTPSVSPFDDIIEPKDVCEKLRISRSKYEEMKRNGFIKDFEMEGGGRKRYVRISQLAQLFPKDFATA